MMTLKFMSTTDRTVEFNSDKILYTPDVRRMILAGALCNRVDYVETANNKMEFSGSTTDLPIVKKIDELGMYQCNKPSCFHYILHIWTYLTDILWY